MTEGEKSFTKTGRMRKATFREVCEWVLAAWKRVKPSMIVNGFRKAGLIPQVDGEADDAVASTSNGACAAQTDVDMDSDEDGTGLDKAILDLFISNTEPSDFEGFSAADD